MSSPDIHQKPEFERKDRVVPNDGKFVTVGNNTIYTKEPLLVRAVCHDEVDGYTVILNSELGIVEAQAHQFKKVEKK